jgi:predicted TIM-barrel fold metal-dependent hydrolase
MHVWSDALRPDGWKVYTLYGPGSTPERAGWFLDDPEIGVPFLEAVREHGPRIVATHKGLGGPVPDPALDASSPRDIGPAARDFPDIDFLVYHSGFELGRPEGHYRESNDHGVDRLVTSLLAADIGPGANVWAELGSTWFLVLRDPPAAAHVLGKLLRAVGPERIVWGTDSTWYGSPQPLIDAFAAFTIPERMQVEHGYPALDAATKRRVLGTNAQSAYRITSAALAAAAADRDRTWVDLVAPALVARLEGGA